MHCDSLLGANGPEVPFQSGGAGNTMRTNESGNDAKYSDL
jgi:hypothetical protein